MENPNYVAPEETTYDIPRGWPKYPVFPDSGDVPGPPIQFEELVPDSVKAGYTFTDPNMIGEVDEYFYHGDHISSVILVTDKKAKVVQQFAYMPFGELLVDNSTVDLDYRFSAKETDRESGLGYFGARYYDNTSAMWCGVDPLWEKYAGMNPYNYCAGNPVMLVDRDGRKIITYSRGENNEAIEYHFVTGEDGKGAFFDNNGNEYNKNEQFIIDLTDALNVLNEGKEGRSLVSNLENI